MGVLPESRPPRGSGFQEDKQTESLFHAERSRLGLGGGGWTGSSVIYLRPGISDFEKCSGSELLFSYTNLMSGATSSWGRVGLAQGENGIASVGCPG